MNYLNDEYTYPRQSFRLFICLITLIGVGFYSFVHLGDAQAFFQGDNLTDNFSNFTSKLIVNRTDLNITTTLTPQEQNPNAYQGNFGILLDDTCLVYLKNNLTTTCPSYEDILILFPDTSVRKVSGEFGYYNGMYQRMPTKLIDSFEYYRFYNHTIMFVDPPVDTKKGIRLIEIKSNLREYKLPSQLGFNAENRTITIGVGRHIEQCKHAFIDSKDWVFLLGDTIKHMSENCTPESTTFNNRFTTKLNQTYMDISTSYKWKLEQYQKESLLICGSKLCLNDKNLPRQPEKTQ